MVQRQARAIDAERSGRRRPFVIIATAAALAWCTLVITPGGTHTAFGYDQLHNRPITLDFLRAHLIPANAAAALPFLDPVAFVHQQYPDLFGRAATPTDIATDADRIARDQTTAPDLLAQYAASTQVQTQVGGVVRSYLGYLGRPPDKTGLAYWVGKARRGSATASVNAAMAHSSEFLRTSTLGTNAAFVAGLYARVLGRTPDPSGAAYWKRRLARGLARRTLVGIFLAEPESARATAPEVPLDAGTFALLTRVPTPSERIT